MSPPPSIDPAAERRAEAVLRRSAIRGLRGYQRPPLPSNLRLRVDGNEGDAQAPDHIALDPEVVRRYPDVRELELRYAAWIGCPPETCGAFAGGDEVLDRVFRAFVEPGQAIVAPTPTFSMIAHYARLAEARTIAPEWVRGAFPRDEVLRALDDSEARVAFLVSPNNPTGLCANRDDLAALADKAPLVVLDHAYVEFADEDLTDAALSLGNVIVVRTLSKAFGLAGLRLGFAIAHRPLLDALRAAGGPFSVASPSASIALGLLADGHEEADASIRRVRAERETLRDLLTEAGFDVCPSQANFVHVRGAEIHALSNELAERGVLIRTVSDPDGSALRISCAGRDSDLLQESLTASLAALPKRSSER